MAGSTSQNAASHPLPPPLDDAAWKHVVMTLALAPQQERIVRLIMHARSDKQIARELDLGRPTIRTYLKRVFANARVEDRMQLVHRVYAIALEHWEQTDRRAS